MYIIDFLIYKCVDITQNQLLSRGQLLNVISRNGRVWLRVPFGTAMFIMFICSENREDL